MNQKQSFRQERAAGILWAPVRTTDFRSQSHWETMLEIAPGDFVLHYAGGVVRARSRVDTGAVEARRPVDLPDDLWAATGRLVRTTYVDANTPVALAEISLERRLGHSRTGPFREDGAVKVGYLYRLDDDFAEAFATAFDDRFEPIPPSVPAEAEDEATDLLRRLIGNTLHTVRGEENVILSVTPPHASVATRRSPQGQPVPVEMVQHALEKLRTTGQVTIEPSEIGYRSAFVGAVLLTLPGTVASGTPPVIRIDPSSANASEGATFEGDLARTQQTETRGEQAALRRRLFGSSHTAQCAVCGETYPVRFLHAAHIKRRSVCSEEEKRDLANIAMPACVFGCDALFELGFLCVGDDGRIMSASDESTPAVMDRLKDLHGRNCLAATDGRAAYFEWHRNNVFRA